MSENQTMESSITTSADDRRQNMKIIKYICAAWSGQVDTVFGAMKKCEELTLTPEQMDIGKDIVQSINEHGDGERSLAAYYLIRYGMLLERGEG